MYSNLSAIPAPHVPAQVQPNQIKVTGEGSLSVAPDKTTIVLGAVTENTSLVTAQQENAAAVTQIVNSLVKLGIPKEHIQTVDYNVQMQYDFVEGKQIFRGYKVTHMLQITVDQVDMTGVVVDTAVSNGANTVSNIQFSVAHPELYYNQALSLAIRNGQQKAMTIATTLGVTLNRHPRVVQEQSRAQEPVPFPTVMYAQASTAATPILAGQLTIKAAVTIEYSFH